MGNQSSCFMRVGISCYSKIASKFPDYYSILGISHNATKREIKRQFYKLSLNHHPDRQRNQSIETKNHYQMIKDAYSILIDESLREEYDKKISQLKVQFKSHKAVYSQNTLHSYHHSPLYKEPIRHASEPLFSWHKAATNTDRNFRFSFVSDPHLKKQSHHPYIEEIDHYQQESKDAVRTKLYKIIALIISPLIFLLIKDQA